jgi:hypothetical protein
MQVAGTEVCSLIFLGFGRSWTLQAISQTSPVASLGRHFTLDHVCQQMRFQAHPLYRNPLVSLIRIAYFPDTLPIQQSYLLRIETLLRIMVEDSEMRRSSLVTTMTSQSSPKTFSLKDRVSFGIRKIGSIAELCEFHCVSLYHM